MDLNKHIANSDDLDTFHSSGIAKSLKGNRLGSVSKITFSQRQQIEQNRRIIYGYHRSTLANSHRDPNNRMLKPAESDVDKTMQIRQGNINQPRINSQPKKYNPYA